MVDRRALPAVVGLSSFSAMVRLPLKTLHLPTTPRFAIRKGGGWASCRGGLLVIAASVFVNNSALSGDRQWWCYLVVKWDKPAGHHGPPTQHLRGMLLRHLEEPSTARVVNYYLIAAIFRSLVGNVVQHCVIADLSIQCSGSEYRLHGSGYSTLWVFAIIWVVLWAVGLLLATLGLLWPDRKKLQDVQAQKQLAGPAQHPKDFYTPYRPASWFFEVVEFAKKLLLIGIIPAVNGDVVGAVIAMLLVNFYLALHEVGAVCRAAGQFDGGVFECVAFRHLNFGALKMDAAHLLNQTSGGFDLQGMGNIADFRTRLESLNTPQAEELDAV